MPALQPKCDSMCSVSCSCHILLSCIAVHRGALLPAQLAATIGLYLYAFRQLYGDGVMIIKFHYTLHLPMYLQKYGMLPNCFVHERKHKLPKRFANEVKITKWNWDASVMREVTSFRLCHLDGIGAKDVSIMDARPCKKRLQALLQQEFNVPDGCVDVIFATGREARINQWENVPRAICAW